LGDDGSLKDGLFEFPDGNTVGAGGFSKEDDVEAATQGVGKGIDFGGQINEFFAVGKEASTQAGNITQNWIGCHLKGSDENKGMSRCQYQDISVGDVIADNEMIFQFQTLQLFRIDDINPEVENPEKLAADKCYIMRQTVTLVKGLPAKELNEKSAGKKTTQPVNNS
jgi:hypothetical protein